MKRISKIFASVLLLFGLVSCNNSNNNNDNDTTEDNYIRGVIIVENYGEMEFELYPDIAPITVANFVDLANDGFYDDLIFHRIIDEFMIQGGGFDISLEQHAADTIKGEFTSNGWENNLHHEKGVLSMARSSANDSASSQFFICYANCDHLDGEYAAFGKLTSGYDVLESIIKVETTSYYSSYGFGDLPTVPVIIDTIKIYE